MTSYSIFSLQNIDKEIESAIASSINNFHLKGGDINSWANNNLRNTIEQTIKSHFDSSISTNNCPTCPPQKKGFGITIGIQVLISYNVRFKGNLNIGYGDRFGDVATSASLHFSAYNSGLGVGVNKDNFVFDITASILLTAGAGKGVPLQSYSINYNSPIPFLNDFNWSLSYGQALTWNSALNENKFSLDRIQREGLVGFRWKDVNVSSNNDTKKLYFGGGTDMGWTGGISIATRFYEIGFQDFTGDYWRIKDKDKHRITPNQDNDDDEWRDVLHNLGEKVYKKQHRQTGNQKNLNKASTYIRFNNKGSQITIDFIDSGWFQDLIHWGINDFRFEYEHKDVQVWYGKNW